MATINYNGMELEEFTTPQIFDPPQEMLVVDEYGDKPIKKKVAAILATGVCQNIVATDNSFWEHCFWIPDPPEPRRATNRELARWLIEGNAQIRHSDSDMVYVGWNYNEFEDDLPCSNNVLVRKWADTEWHEPDVFYMEIEKENT